MSDTLSQLKETYSQFTDDSLMQLSIDGGLTLEAKNTLAKEMQTRSLTREDVSELKKWEDAHPKFEPPTINRPLFSIFRFVGKKFLSTADESNGIYVATRFVVLRGGMPVIPIGSYRVQQRGRELPFICNRVPMQWDQVWAGLKTTLITVVVGGAVGLLLGYLKNKYRYEFRWL